MKVLIKNNDGTYYASKFFEIINKKQKDEYDKWTINLNSNYYRINL